ncbi:MAG: hypothetical protein PF489_07995 [Salinivirgaceae bacterium]|nr:hypothetical protein [Salinivirgaceae bacterium]
MIRGNDGVSKSDWYYDLEQNPYINYGQLFLQTGTPAQRDATIVTDPANPSNHALRFRIAEKHIFLDGGTNVKSRI